MPPLPSRQHRLFALVWLSLGGPGHSSGEHHAYRCRADGQPYFAGYVAAEWMTYAADWNTADRQFLQGWLFSPEAREVRAEAIDFIRDRLLGEFGGRVPYPYQVQDGEIAIQEGSRLRQ